MLSPRGTLEADLTVTKLPPRPGAYGGGGGDGEGFLVVATDTAHRHVETLLRRGIEDHAAARGVAPAATVSDVTGGLAQINLQGPRSRELLAALTSADVSDAAFPFRAARRVDIGCALVLATRITYVSEARRGRRTHVSQPALERTRIQFGRINCIRRSRPY